MKALLGSIKPDELPKILNNKKALIMQKLSFLSLIHIVLEFYLL